MKISTFGVPMSGNKGSASMLQGILDSLPAEIGDVTFNVFTYYPKIDIKLNKAKNVNVLSGTPLSLALYLIPVSFIIYLMGKIKIKLPGRVYGRGVRELIESDIIIEAGGTTFKDEKLVKILFNVACLLPGILLQKKVIKYSQTMGPFKKAFNRIAARSILPKLELIIARGRYSENNLKGVGLKNCTYCADASFSMDISDREMNVFMLGEFEKINKSKRDRLVVGVSPNCIVEGYCRKNHINHAEIFGSFINYLITKGFFVVLIPHSYRPYTKMKHNNDRLTVKEICNYISDKDSFYAVKKDYNCKELRVLIGMMDYYVASRFHSMISALATGVPVIVVGWGQQKYLEVMEEFELEKYCFGFDILKKGAQGLVMQFERMIQDEEIIKEKISKNLPEIIASSKKQVFYVKQIGLRPIA